jgi:hypothetical protein
MKAGKPDPCVGAVTVEAWPQRASTARPRGIPVDKLLIAVENSIMNENSTRCGGAACPEAGGYAHPAGARRTDAAIRRPHPSITIPGIHT